MLFEQATRLTVRPASAALATGQSQKTLPAVKSTVDHPIAGNSSSQMGLVRKDSMTTASGSTQHYQPDQSQQIPTKMNESHSQILANNG